MAIPAQSIWGNYIKTPFLKKQYKNGFLILLLYLDISPKPMSGNTPYRQNINLLVNGSILRQLYTQDW